MARPQIVIHLQRGNVRQVYSSDRDADVIVIDWDLRHPQPYDSQKVAVPIHHRKVLSRVREVLPRPLHELAGSHLERAVEAAFEEGVLAEPAC